MKSLVIHSLPRAGGTMLERLVDSQPEMICAPFLFNVNELRDALEAVRVTRVNHGTTLESLRLGTRKHMLQVQLLALLSNAVNANPFRLVEADVSPDMLLCGVPLKRWYEAMAMLATSRDAAALEDPLYAMGSFLGVRVFASHWTKSLWYAPHFLKSENSYWIEILRNPYDRLISERKTAPNAKLIDKLDAADEQFHFVESFRHPRFLVVKYEDVCEQPERELNRISEWLGEPLELAPLNNIYGEPFYPNSSKAVDEGKSYMYQDTSLGTTIGSLVKERWVNERSQHFVAMVNATVNSRGHYRQENTGTATAWRATLSIMRMRGRERLRDALVGLFARSGLHVSRNILH